jgi:hypothetical protein
MSDNSEDVSFKQQASQVYEEMKNYYQQNPRLQHVVWQNKPMPAFWTIASLLSLTINVILIVVLILMGRQLFLIKGIVSEQLISGLYENFVLMDQAHIVTSITVNDTIQVIDTIPVVFDLPLEQNTTVVLTDDTSIGGATIYLNQSPVPIDIVLPAGTSLNINLDLVVPVSQTVPVELTVPVNLEVPVDIAMEQTQLHEPFVGLQGVVAPYQDFLSDLPDSWQETPFCGFWTNWLCVLLLENQLSQ